MNTEVYSPNGSTAGATPGSTEPTRRRVFATCGSTARHMRKNAWPAHPPVPGDTIARRVPRRTPWRAGAQSVGRSPGIGFRRCRRLLRAPVLAAAAALLLQAPGFGTQSAVAQTDPQTQQVERSDTAININTASAAELATVLNGVGASRAEAIVRYREQFGPFESVDELAEVSGIGAATVERNRNVLRVD